MSGTAQTALPGLAANPGALAWEQALDFACSLTVELPLAHFTVRQALQLTPGMVLSSAWHQSADVPMRVNGRLIAWGEFEVIERALAVRLTELA